MCFINSWKRHFSWCHDITNQFFSHCSKTQKHLWNQYNFNFFFARKNSPREIHFFLSHVCGEKLGKYKTCRTSAAKITFLFWPLHLRLFIIRHVKQYLRVRSFFFYLKKKRACGCGAVNDYNKMYSTSAVPLLVRNVSYVCGAVARNSRNISKTKLKKHWIS